MTNDQTQSIQMISPIDPQTLIKHGDSPTAIILAIAVFLFLACKGLTAIIQAILQAKN